MTNETVIGRISFDKNESLGEGSFGHVFRGFFDRQVPVAVKRIKKRKGNVESDALRKANGHPHVIRYYGTEDDSKYFFIAIELCAASLEDLVLGDYKGPTVGMSRDIFIQITEGVAYLHEKNVIHRDLKPANILISHPDGTTGPQIKLADFGISRIVRGNRRDLTVTRDVPSGTDGWMAPELFQPSERYTSAVDVFSLGLVFGYTATGGKHPFGNDFLRTSRIIQNQPILNEKDMCVIAEDEQNELFRLIESMLNAVPCQRPTASQVLNQLLNPDQSEITIAPPAIPPIERPPSPVNEGLPKNTVQMGGVVGKALAPIFGQDGDKLRIGGFVGKVFSKWDIGT